MSEKQKITCCFPHLWTVCWSLNVRQTQVYSYFKEVNVTQDIYPFPSTPVLGSIFKSEDEGKVETTCKPYVMLWTVSGLFQ